MEILAISVRANSAAAEQVMSAEHIARHDAIRCASLLDGQRGEEARFGVGERA